MKSFRTEIKLFPAASGIQLADAVLTVGSCFSDSIGGLLNESKFNAAVNPMGTLYSPLAIHKVLHYALTETLPEAATWVHFNSRWSNFDFHSSFSGSTLAEAENEVAATVRTTHAFLKSASLIMVTYGTAWVYERAETGERVANCHKLPSSRFRRILLSQEEIIRSFQELHTALKILNPGIKIILTLSPVRHLKDTLSLNSVSKAILRSAIHAIVSAHDDTDYFPAFEIMTDDLRDYRFYEDDMIHPSTAAIEYLWEKFGDRYFDSDLRHCLPSGNQLPPPFGTDRFIPKVNRISIF